MYLELLGLEEDVFKVIANQKRLEIIQLLDKRELNVSEMIEMLGLRQANLSQHLALLRQHKLVTVNKKGRESYYKLSDKRIAKAVGLIYQFLQAEHGVRADFSAEDVFPIVTDPVCGMRLSASEAFSSFEHGGKTYYFCASGCTHKFSKRPQKFVK
jgi:DNA-binding transcriptional ArsR family regulator/YHS domain-containing protein